ncbi:hypothetical protein FO519_005070 [Halicephalobus sp. NKZ332]|nr:hypothetical protein FO519_005070 [Halicephalobus sp. NKZ332]
MPLAIQKVFCYFLIFTVIVAVVSAAPEDKDFTFDENIGEEPLVEKRIPHPSWRSNVRINHISHQNPGAPYLRFYDNGFSRPAFVRWAKRPYAFTGDY